MGTKVTEFKSEEKKNKTEIADLLRQMADKIDSGKIMLVQGDETTELDFPETCNLELKVEKKVKKTGIKRSLEIEIEWFENNTAEPLQIK